MVVPALFFSLIGFLDCSSVVTAIIFLIIVSPIAANI